MGGILGCLLLSLGAFFFYYRLKNGRKAMATTSIQGLDQGLEKRDQTVVAEAGHKDEPLGGRLHPSNEALDSGRLKEDT